MIDPVDSLAFSIQANRGVYALLLGSGVSRDAQIPTGWDITLDLIRKLASTSGESAEPDPERWYLEKYKAEPDYSKLVDELAKTQAERQQLLRPYFKRNQEEQEEDTKQPTAAHRAIARLVADGFVRVILTTNFDRLMERALEEAGIEPTVVSSPDQVQGMLPLAHIEHCLVKLHGDYRDTRIRNTPLELDEYPDEFNKLLDQVFDEFGLIACGWSADWDAALRAAILRAPSRRFTTYWATRGDPGEEAQHIISQRRAQVIEIESADRFFSTVQEKVESIEEFSRPHPLSAEATVASLKRYLSEPRFRIQLSDLVDETIDRTIEQCSSTSFSIHDSKPSSSTVTARVRAYEAACSTLLAMAMTGGRWAEPVHFDLWRSALERLSTVPNDTGETIWRGLQRYPATLVLYALGLGALAFNRLDFIQHIFATGVSERNGASINVTHILPPFCILDTAFESQQAMQLLEGMERQRAPLSVWMYQTLRQYYSRIDKNEAKYRLTFDKMEVLIALSFAHHAQRPVAHYWAPPGLYAYRYDDQAILEIETSIHLEKDAAPFVRSGIFGNTVDECLRGVSALKEFVGKVKWS